MLATFLAVPLLEDGSELLTNSISLEPVGGVLETHLTYSTGLYVVNLLRPTGFPFYPEFQKFKNFMFFFFKKKSRHLPATHPESPLRVVGVPLQVPRHVQGVEQMASLCQEGHGGGHPGLGPAASDTRHHNSPTCSGGR